MVTPSREPSLFTKFSAESLDAPNGVKKKLESPRIPYSVTKIHVTDARLMEIELYECHDK